MDIHVWAIPVRQSSVMNPRLEAVILTIGYTALLSEVTVDLIHRVLQHPKLV
jgi:hypothetical protein